MLHEVKAIGLGQLAQTAVSICRHGFTLLTLLDSVKKAPACINDGREQVSYAGLYTQSVSLAAHLQAQYAIGPGSRVALAGNNSVGFVRALFALSGLGADVFLLKPNEKAGYYQKLIQEHKIDVCVGGQNLCPGLNIPFYSYLGEVPSGKPLKRRGVKKSNLIILTSGSTGTPKAESRKATVSQYLYPLVDIIEKLQLKESRSVLISVPLFHGYGLAALSLSLFLKQDVFLQEKFDAQKTLNLMRHYKPDTWIAVPVMIQKVLADEANISVKSIISGGDVLPATVVLRVQNGGVKLCNLYGTSETGICTIATNDDLLAHPDTIGKAIKGTQTRILPNGNLLVKCAWSSERNEGGYVPTGDMMAQNTEGYFFYKGRLDDMMVIGGENVYPVEVEHAVYRHPGIKWVKAKPKTENSITKVHIDIVPHHQAAFSTEGFLSWISGEVPGYMIPRSVAILPEVPETKLL